MIDYKKYIINGKESFDIIFADPPYIFSIKQYIEMIDLIKKNNILRDKGEVIIEHSSKITLLDYNSNTEERKYGSSILSIIKKASL